MIEATNRLLSSVRESFYGDAHPDDGEFPCQDNLGGHTSFVVGSLCTHDVCRDALVEHIEAAP